MNKKASREEYILNALQSSSRMTTGEAANILGISEATVRRVFSDLEKAGKVVRNYGGIQLAENAPSYSFEQREKIFQQEKVGIGRLAAAAVSDEDTIYLDCGTTIFQMTLALSARIARNEFSSLRIITNSIANTQAIAPSPNCKVYLIGGEYNDRRRDFSGPLTEKYLAPFHFTKCFLGCDGMHIQSGFSSNQIDISSLNTCVIERSDSKYVLLDSSKFNQCSLIAYAGLSEIDGIFTNEIPDASLQKTLSASGLEVFVPDVSH